MMVLRTVTFRGMCDNVNLISTETFWQSSEMLMWWLVGIFKWTADWLSFYWTIKTALNGTTQRSMSSAYLLNVYQLFSPFKKNLMPQLTDMARPHMNITEIPNWSHGSLTWHPTLVFVLFGQHNHVKPTIKQHTAGASKASAKTLVSKAHWWFVFISQNLLQLYYSPFICTTAIA